MDGSRRLRRRLLFVVLLVGLAVFLVPGVAQAHAILLSSSPAAGARLGTTPGIVVLRFVEPVDPKLSTATVTDPNGRSATGRGSGGTISVPLATNAPGVYRVSWRSVSLDDGHTVRGSFEFSVVARAAGGASGSSGADPGQVVISIFRTIQFVALLFAMGMVLVRRLARRDPRLPWVRTRLREPLAVALVSGLVVVIGEAVSATSSLSPAALGSYFVTGLPGRARIVVVVAEALAFAASMASAPVLGSLLAAFVGIAAAGHAADVHPRWFGVSVDAAHLVAAGVWAGGIMALATLRPPGGWRGPSARQLLDRFSPVAITAFLIAVGLGVVQATQDVGSVSGLLHTHYGTVLLAKIAGVAAMIPLSILAWRRRVAPRFEAGIAVLVVAAAAALAAFPLPASSLPAGSEASPSLSPSVVPGAGDLTLGSHAGQVLIGLTVHPARPGENQLSFYLLPLEGSAATLDATLTIHGKSVPLEPCGANCRRTNAVLQGHETVDVSISPPLGGVASFDIPSLPAPSGSALLQRAQARMHQLSTFRLDEVLNSGLATVRSTYEFQAPDRLESVVSDRFQTVIIGGTRYTKDGAAAKWVVESGGPSIPEPSFIWDYFKPYRDARIIGAEPVGGVATQIVSFLGQAEGSPIWFRLWIDRSGLVRQAQMRADGHFMDHRYFDFDAPIAIVPPTGPS